MNADVDDFERLAAALEPWLSALAVVGGWAHRLHHQHPLALAPTYMPVRTRDSVRSSRATKRHRSRDIMWGRMTKDSTPSSSRRSSVAASGAMAAPTPPSHVQASMRRS